jgi:Abortive infection C-terminus
MPTFARILHGRQHGQEMTDDDLRSFPSSARDAVQATKERVERAASAGDVEAVVGASKELIEASTKIALDSLGRSYGSNASIGALAAAALEALEIHPRALKGRRSLQRLASSLLVAAEAIGELRNTDGTGHGRSAGSDLDPSHAELVRSISAAWATWILVTTRNAVSARADVEEALIEIGGARAFSQGRFRAYLEEVRVQDMRATDQRRLGLATARRWTENGTFMPVHDVIDPVAEGKLDLAPPFDEGLAEGLLLDHNGFIKTTGDDVRRAIRIVLRLPGDRIDPFLRSLADRISAARPAQALADEARAEAANALLELARDEPRPVLQRSLVRMAARLNELGER